MLSLTSVKLRDTSSTRAIVFFKTTLYSILPHPSKYWIEVFYKNDFENKKTSKKGLLFHQCTLNTWKECKSKYLSMKIYQEHVNNRLFSPLLLPHSSNYLMAVGSWKNWNMLVCVAAYSDIWKEIQREPEHWLLDIFFFHSFSFTVVLFMPCVFTC